MRKAVSKRKTTDTPAAAPDAKPAILKKSMIDIFDERYEERPVCSGALEEERRAREANNQRTVLSCADGALKRWQLKLREAKVKYCAAPPPDPPGDWVLSIGPSALARRTSLQMGGGRALGDVYGAEWSISQYNSEWAHAHPVYIYGEKPQDLWPGSSVNNYLDLALVMAGGVVFSVSHKALPVKEREDVGKELRNGDMWARYVDFPSVYASARDDKELMAGVMEVAERILDSARQTTITENKTNARLLHHLKEKVTARNAYIQTIPKMGTAFM